MSASHFQRNNSDQQTCCTSVWILTKRANQRAAFTLMELIVALMLGSILMLATTAVLRRCFSEIRVALDQDPRLGRTGLLLEQLRRDMANARRIRIGNNRFELIGYIHRDPATLIATLRPARVIYEIRRDGNQSVLVRVQMDVSGGAGASFGSIASRPFVEQVYVGASTLLVTSNEISSSSFSEADTIGSLGNARTMQMKQANSMPTAIQFLMLDQKGRTLLSHTFSRQRNVN